MQFGIFTQCFVRYLDVRTNFHANRSKGTIFIRFSKIRKNNRQISRGNRFMGGPLTHLEIDDVINRTKMSESTQIFSWLLPYSH